MGPSLLGLHVFPHLSARARSMDLNHRAKLSTLFRHREMKLGFGLSLPISKAHVHFKSYIYLFVYFMNSGRSCTPQCIWRSESRLCDLVLSFTRWLPAIKLRPSDPAGRAFNCYAIPTSTWPTLLAAMFTSSSSLGDFFFFYNFQVVRK